jgi:glycerol-3-phosphate dehydrogenase subunit B
MSRRVLVIGGGLAGLTAGLAAARAGASVTIANLGQGVHHLFSGCVDVMGSAPAPLSATRRGVGGEVKPPPTPPVSRGEGCSPLAAIELLAKTHPDHPHSKVGAAQVRRALRQFLDDMTAAGMRYEGDGETARRVATTLGTIRTTALVPATMAIEPERIEAACNINACQNFAAELFAGELARRIGKPVAPLHFRHGARRHDVLGVSRQFRDPDFVAAFGAFLRQRAAGRVVAIPAVLGVEGADDVKAKLEGAFGGVLCELPGQPPSLAGLRVFVALRRALLDASVRLVQNARVVGPLLGGGALIGVRMKTGHVVRNETADAVVLASGHLVSGGIVGDRDGLREAIFNLPLSGQPQPPFFHERFLWAGGHSALSTGVAVNETLQPLADGRIVHENLFACGDILAGFDPYRERSGGGAALATGDLAGRLAAGGAR